MRYLAIPLLAVLLGACSDPKEASEKNFKSAVQSYLDSAYPRCYLVSNFPAIASDFDIGGKNRNMAALAKVGLLTATEVQQEEKQIFSSTPRTVTRTAYDLTAEGKKFFKPAIAKNMRGEEMGGICAGKATVTAIGNFSEPAEMMGQKVSRVNYEFTVNDLPAWASSAEVQQSVRGIKEDLESKDKPIKRLEAVILTNNGWVHEKMFSR